MGLQNRPFPQAFIRLKVKTKAIVVGDLAISPSSFLSTDSAEARNFLAAATAEARISSSLKYF